MTIPDFSRPHDVPYFDAVLGGSSNLKALMPRWEDIPDEFRRGHTRFNEIQSEWFFRGLPVWPLDPKPGIDHRKALAHLSAIQRSFEPQHEHKEAAVAYLLSLWYDVPAGGRPGPVPPAGRKEPEDRGRLDGGQVGREGQGGRVANREGASRGR